jgi:hypothetical protein
MIELVGERAAVSLFISNVHEQIEAGKVQAAEGAAELAADRALLEEPHMEATGCRAFPDSTRRGRFVRLALGAAVIDCIVPRFAAQLALTTITGQPVSRDLAGRALTYLHARAHYGVVDPSALAALEPIWRQVLGRKDVEALDDLYAQLIWVPDGENEPLSEWARRYRDIIGPPDDEPRAGSDKGDIAGSSTPGRGRRAPRRSARCARRSSARAARRGARGPARAARRGRRPGVDARARGHGHAGRIGHGLRYGRTDRTHARPRRRPPAVPRRGARGPAPRPAPAARPPPRAATHRQAHPGGRFDGRTYTRARFERATGRPTTSHPWTITREITAPVQEPHALLVVDTSGSMLSIRYGRMLNSPFKSYRGTAMITIHVLASTSRSVSGQCSDV